MLAVVLSWLKALRFSLRAVATGGKGLAPGNLSFAKRTKVVWMSGT
jgi:hypothetical protein